MMTPQQTMHVAMEDIHEIQTHIEESQSLHTEVAAAGLCGRVRSWSVNGSNFSACKTPQSVFSPSRYKHNDIAQ